VDAFNITYVQQALPMLTAGSGDPDAALAHLSVAMDDFRLHTPGDKSNYACWLKHYYAEALHQTCLTDSYATCEEAAQIYQELGQWPRCQSILKTTSHYYLQAQANSIAQRTNAAMATGDYAAAAEGWAAIYNIAKTEDLSSIGLSPDLVKTWAGLTYIKLGLQRRTESSEDASKAFTLAVEQLGAVQNPGPVAKQSKEILTQLTDASR
jgi:hypothetical protein